MKPIPAIVLAPLIVHPVWAGLMATSPAPVHAMGIDSLYQVMPSATSAIVVMTVASLLAWLSHLEKLHGTFWGLAAIMPQQALLLLSAWTIMASVISGQYADGYRPLLGWRFIVVDQLFFFVCALLHTRSVWGTYILHRSSEPEITKGL